MPHDLDLYEPRKDDDREETTLDEDKTYCANCSDEIYAEDMTAVPRHRGRINYWIHAACVDEAQDAAEEFAPSGCYEWRALRNAFLAGVAWETLRQLKENKS